MHRHVNGSFQYVVSGVIDKQVQKIIHMHIISNAHPHIYANPSASNFKRPIKKYRLWYKHTHTRWYIYAYDLRQAQELLPQGTVCWIDVVIF